MSHPENRKPVQTSDSPATDRLTTLAALRVHYLDDPQSFEIPSSPGNAFDEGFSAGEISLARELCDMAGVKYYIAEDY